MRVLGLLECGHQSIPISHDWAFSVGVFVVRSQLYPPPVAWTDADAENLGRCSHPGGCDPTRWDSFGKAFEPLGSIVPTMTTPGNHEIELVSVGDRALGLMTGCNVTDTPFLEYRFRWFTYSTDSPEALHYSWNIGNVHNIMLNS